MVRIAVAGSRALGTYGVSFALRMLIGIKERPLTILLRAPAYTDVGVFESALAASVIEARLGEVEWFRPVPDAEGRIGRAGVFNRDIEMVASADIVFAFVATSDMTSLDTSGTLHIIEKAQDQDRPAYLWLVEASSARLVGSHQPAVDSPT